MNYKQLSKNLSRALRHNPKDYGITLDDEGWTDLDQLITNLQRRKNAWQVLNKKHFEAMMAESEKQRFEIQGDKIRAVYGHSIKKKITKKTATPPEILYHGTPRKVVPLIQKGGLKSMGRQYVHLSKGVETAMVVGKRRDHQPVILEVKALEAFESGILFYEENDGIWLSEPIPPAFIVFE